jgi:hypothetical protein
MPTESDEEYNDVRETREREMRKSLEIAIAVWNFLGEVMRDKAGEDVKLGGGFKLLNWTEVTTLIEKTFGAKVHKKRIDFLQKRLQDVIFRSFDSCGLWEFAHAIDHGLYDDLSTF